MHRPPRTRAPRPYRLTLNPGPTDVGRALTVGTYPTLEEAAEAQAPWERLPYYRGRLRIVNPAHPYQ